MVLDNVILLTFVTYVGVQDYKHGLSHLIPRYPRLYIRVYIRGFERETYL
jgi:hypothetical protein